MDSDHTLHDNRDAFYRAKANMYRRHSKMLEKRLTNDEVTAWERTRAKELIAEDQEHIKYWEQKAKAHKPQF